MPIVHPPARLSNPLVAPAARAASSRISTMRGASGCTDCSCRMCMNRLSQPSHTSTQPSVLIHRPLLVSTGTVKPHSRAKRSSSAWYAAPTVSLPHVQPCSICTASSGPPSEARAPPKAASLPTCACVACSGATCSAMARYSALTRRRKASFTCRGLAPGSAGNHAGNPPPSNGSPTTGPMRSTRCMPCARHSRAKAPTSSPCVKPNRPRRTSCMHHGTLARMVLKPICFSDAIACFQRSGASSAYSRFTPTSHRRLPFQLKL